MTLIDPSFLQTRPGLPPGRFDVDALAECASTNSELLRRAEQGAPSGTVIVADQQSAGRGRRGRRWLSQPADSLTFSLLWRFSGAPARLTGLSLAIGVAMARGLENLGAQNICLKWPNDILLRQGDDFAKLAGILIELSSDRRGTQAIIGIGLNLQAPEDNLPQPAAGLQQALAHLPERHDIFAALLAALAVTLDTFAVDGFAGLKSTWQQRHAWQDLPVHLLEDGQAVLSGICRGADRDGALLLENDSGLQRIFSGDLSLRRA
jgi:BirA family biotin operon repressor/biotin-[acetyl-CoA-carboxylase] ligase